MAQFEVGGISGFLLVFPGVIALTHEWTDFVRRLVAVHKQPMYISICPSTAFAITLAARNLHRTGKIRPNSKTLRSYVVC